MLSPILPHCSSLPSRTHRLARIVRPWISLKARDDECGIDLADLLRVYSYASKTRNLALRSNAATMMSRMDSKCMLKLPYDKLASLPPPDLHALVRE